MPLRDHFRLPVENAASFEDVLGAWPAAIAYRLNVLLPARYRCSVKAHRASENWLTIDDGEKDEEFFRPNDGRDSMNSAPESMAPAILLETEELAPAESEVRVHDLRRGNRLVAALELVGPTNKDRPRSRKAFASKCHALLQQDVCVAIVDTVSNQSANLYAELADRLCASIPTIATRPTYAVSCRIRPGRKGTRVETWERGVEVGSPLPTIPLWLNERFAVDLALEATYEETCRGLRIPS